MKLDQHYTENAIRTYTGLPFDIKILDPDTISIEDIAHALSLTPRWGGHTKELFSVAQHCVLAAWHVAEGYELEALMHDASEAYLQDMPAPIKSLLPDYRKLEGDLMAAIAKKFKFEYPPPPVVKEIDSALLSAEWDQVVIGDSKYSAYLNYWRPQDAEAKFLEAFNQYKRA